MIKRIMLLFIFSFIFIINAYCQYIPKQERTEIQNLIEKWFQKNDEASFFETIGKENYSFDIQKAESSSRFYGYYKINGDSRCLCFKVDLKKKTVSHIIASNVSKLSETVVPVNYITYNIMKENGLLQQKIVLDQIYLNKMMHFGNNIDATWVFTQTLGLSAFEYVFLKLKDGTFFKLEYDLFTGACESAEVDRSQVIDAINSYLIGPQIIIKEKSERLQVLQKEN